MSRWLVRLFLQSGRWVLLVSAVVVSSILWILLNKVDPRFPATEGASGVESLAAVLRSAVVISAATGLIALSIIQALKYLSSLRGWFHRNEVARYLSSYGSKSPAWLELEAALGTTSLQTKDLGMYQQTRNLRYFFDLPLEQLTGQISAAAELALSKPYDYQNLLKGLLHPQGTEQLGIVIDAGVPEPGEESALVIEARNHVGLLLQRAIDSMQIVIGHRWRWLLRALALCISFPIAVIGTQYAGIDGLDRAVVTILSTLLGGFFAWVARDVIAVIERLRR